MFGKIKSNYNHTIYACYIGYITQAIVNNFAPLLFLTFREEFGIPLEKITDNNIKIDGIVGVSAGALFGVNYFSKQRARL